MLLRDAHPEREPHLWRLWTQTFSRPIRFDEAELEIDPYMTALHQRRKPGTRFADGEMVRRDQSKEYQTDFSKPATFLFASWVVPGVLGVLLPEWDLLRDTKQVVGFWISIDAIRESVSCCRPALPRSPVRGSRSRRNRGALLSSR